MSGGSRNYLFSMIACQLDIPIGHYGDIRENNKDYRLVRKINPMDDVELSELMYDVMCLLHSLEWYESADTDEETYRNDIKAFKNKWFGVSREEQIKKQTEKIIDDTKEELFRMFGLRSEEDGNK